MQSEFFRLIKDDPSIPDDLCGFVSRAYSFKTIADYDPPCRRRRTMCGLRSRQLGDLSRTSGDLLFDRNAGGKVGRLPLGVWDRYRGVTPGRTVPAAALPADIVLLYWRPVHRVQIISLAEPSVIARYMRAGS